MVIPVDKTPRPKTPPLEAVSYGEKKMGLVYADLELISGDDLALHRRGFITEDQIKRMSVNALVDSGAYMLVINEHIKVQLDLPVLGEKAARLADESEITAEIVGPIEIRFENRRASVDALVLPGNAEPLLGVIPMEDMDLVVDPKQQRLIVNPENPNIATAYVK
ncbi:MAG: clan AA aspartic protease [Acidobacteriota bacterium]|nr:clan AA aspartic protease [Acidobacteriota bacterium]